MAMPTETLEKLQSINCESEDRYSVFIYWVNRDLIPPSGEPPLFGIVIPCGEYNKRKAEQERDRLAAETGAHCVVWCNNNQAFPLRAQPGTNTIVYPHNINKSVDEITNSIKKAKQNRAAVDGRAAKEVEERPDSDSMSYLINIIYKTTSSKIRADKFTEIADASRKAHGENFDLVVDHFRRHPEHRVSWEAEAKERFTERGELVLYEQMRVGMQLLMPSSTPTEDESSP